MRYELGFYVPEDDIRHSHCCENLRSYLGGNVSILPYFIKDPFWSKANNDYYFLFNTVFHVTLVCQS
jgi:hypothetical protein